MKATVSLLTFMIAAITGLAGYSLRAGENQDTRGAVQYTIPLPNNSVENRGELWHILGHDWSEDLWSDDAKSGSTSADIETDIDRQRCVLMSPGIASLKPGMTIRIAFYSKWLEGDNTVFVSLYSKGVVGPSPAMWKGAIPKDNSWHKIVAELKVPAFLVDECQLNLRIGIPYPKQSHWRKPCGDFELSHYLVDDISIAVLDIEIEPAKQPRKVVEHSFDAGDVRDNPSPFGVYWTPWKAYSRTPLKSPQDLNRSKEEIEHDLDLMKQAGVKWIRSIWRWDKIEWNKGAPDYSFLDYVVEEALKRDIRILPGLYHTPRWTSTAPEDNDEYYAFPPQMDDWDRFVYELVAHFRTKIKYWEIWNEPNHWFGYYWQGTIEEFCELQKVAYRAAKRADPGCKVLIGSFSDSGFGDLYRLLQMGAGEYFDIVSIHPYSNKNLNIDNAIHSVKAVRLALAQFDCEDKPIWFTEIGWPGDLAPSVSDQQRTEMMTLLYNHPFHESVEKIFWFPWSRMVFLWGSRK